MRRRVGHGRRRLRSSPWNSHQSSDPVSKNGYTRWYWLPPPRRTTQ
jgi:hypothetical protein